MIQQHKNLIIEKTDNILTGLLRLHFLPGMNGEEYLPAYNNDIINSAEVVYIPLYNFSIFENDTKYNGFLFSFNKNNRAEKETYDEAVLKIKKAIINASTRNTIYIKIDVFPSIMRPSHFISTGYHCYKSNISCCSEDANMGNIYFTAKKQDIAWMYSSTHKPEQAEYNVYQLCGPMPVRKCYFFGHREDALPFSIDNISEDEERELERIINLETPEYNAKANPIYDLVSTKNGFALKKKPIKTADRTFINEFREHLPQDERESFDPDMIQCHVGLDSNSGMDRLVGLDSVQTEIKKLKAKLIYNKSLKERGIDINTAAGMHMCLLGNPGTGKTTVARMITGVLYEMGYIKENVCMEVSAQRMKASYLGQTGKLVKNVIECSKGKVLFIDEAHGLYDTYEKGYAKDAVATIIKEMEDNREDVVIIFAGYKEEMQHFLDVNQGLRSRINRYIEFPDYSPMELTRIFHLKAYNNSYRVDLSLLKKVYSLMLDAAKIENFGNARYATETVYQSVVDTHAKKMIKHKGEYDMNILDASDFPTSLQEGMGITYMNENLYTDMFKTSFK